MNFKEHTNLSIRKVNTNEAQTLLDLSRKTFFDAFAALNNPDDMAIYAAEAFTLQKIQSELQHPHSSFYFAVADDELLGYIKLNTSTAQNEFKNDNSLEVARIYVLAQHQGKKIGEALINFATSTAQQLVCNYIWLGVWETNHSAIRFYKRHGFAQSSTHYFMLGNDKQTDILMKKQL